jgi:hypothetical protein
MCSAIVLWFALRYTFGDDLFDRLFPFRRLPFILTQKWHLPFRMEEDLSRGNWLHDFFDSYTDDSHDTSSEVQPTVQVRTVYNHSKYLHKHPAGAARLQNVIEIGAECIVFSPLGPSIMSMDLMCILSTKPLMVKGIRGGDGSILIIGHTTLQTIEMVSQVMSMMCCAFAETGCFVLVHKILLSDWR